MDGRLGILRVNWHCFPIRLFEMIGDGLRCVPLRATVAVERGAFQSVRALPCRRDVGG